MNIAICFSGQIRTGLFAAPSIKRYLGDLWKYCTFFCHTWDINTRKPYNSNGIQRELYPLNYKDLVLFLKFYGLVNNKNFKMDNFSNVSKEKTDLVWTPMQYSWRKSVELMLDRQKKLDKKFDLVIKLRPDYLPHPSRNATLEIANCFLKNDRDCFFSENDYGENFMEDVLYFATPDVMEKASNYATIEENIGIIGLKKYLNIENIKIFKITNGLILSPYLYTILREESLHRDPINDWEGCYNDDIFYYAPR